MFTPLAMQHVTISLLREDAPLVALLLAQRGEFAPQLSREAEELLPDAPGEKYRQLFGVIQVRLNKLLNYLSINPQRAAPPANRVVTEQELSQLNDWLGPLWEECSACEESEHSYRQQLAEIDQLLLALQQYQALDIDLGLLQGGFQFLDVNIGTTPLQNVTRLTDAVSLIGYSLSVFSRHESVAHIIVAGLHDEREKLAPVLESASFQPLEIPPQFHDKPSEVRQELNTRKWNILLEEKKLKQEIRQRRDEVTGKLLEAFRTMVSASTYVQLGDALKGKGGLAHITGWVPACRSEEIRQTLESKLAGRFVIEYRDPAPEEWQQVPSATPHSSLLRPFSQLVKSYGIPRYGELDPTWLFAVTFIAMFGMMFGDVGHGAVIALAAAWFRKKLMGAAPLLIAAGISSTVFGFVYGSIFGYEHVIPALWIAPLSDPNLMLTVAMFWGIAFILLATLITVRNRLVQGRINEALYDTKGIAGVLFYLALLYMGFRWASEGSVGWLEKTLILVPFITILIYKWRQLSASFGERLLVVAIEGFETLMSYVSNTLSFLRVAAFSLNHVALAIAVFTMADMMGTTGHWITVVLGNIFILVLEGAIVIIQILRLEYFEGFSRFFSGDGREFQPIELSPDQVFTAQRTR